MIDKIMSWLIAYIEIGLDFLIKHLFTLEGIIALIFGMFFLGLVARIRS